MSKKKVETINESEFLYYGIENISKYNPSFEFKEIPRYILDNLSIKFIMRSYQEKAFKYTMHYIEEMAKNKQIHLLYHMATGSGKTYIMAGMILYFYKRGYRNFLFFVNNNNIVEKTKDNFLNQRFGKYLFADNIVIDGEKVDIKNVENFQDYDEDSINIKFTTIQQLHKDLTINREGNTTLQDFEDIKVVMIADEAHHINADTKKKLSKEENENIISWESAVNKVYTSNKDNVILEFTATCDLKNKNILEKYKDKIIFNYPLLKFREEGYTKEFLNLQSTLDPMHRVVQAMLLSQYRLKVFEKYGKIVKPTILLKARTITENKQFFEEFSEYILKEFSTQDIELIRNVGSGIIEKMFLYYKNNNIDDEMLVQELKQAFSSEHLMIMDSKDPDKVEKQRIVNDLENINNPYRMIFTVDMLNEGWDVLNLFDIVRLYDTRQGGNKISKVTMTEAQLIGRGVRYCPFQISDEDEKFKRKYDNDLENELRICETLYYHSKEDSKYIDELRKALREIGLETNNVVEFTYKVKDEFKEKYIYKSGKLFINRREKKSRKDIKSLPSNFVFTEKVDFTNKFKEVGLADEVIKAKSIETEKIKKNINISKLSKYHYPIVYKAARQYSVFRFNRLINYFPHLKSLKEFITSEEYAGQLELNIIADKKTNNEPNNIEYYQGCLKLFGTLSEKILSIKEEYKGTYEFTEVDLKKYIKDTDRKKLNPDSEGEGISQNAITVNDEYRLDLSKDEFDWFVYNDNYGTTEEKRFVKFFSNKVDELKKVYDEVYLIRNERNLHIYSFKDGLRFEPDYILLLKKNNSINYEQQQIFVEPKGEQLFKQDNWKEEFLLEMEQLATTKCYHNNNDEFKVLGLPFFNEKEKLKEFKEAFDELLPLKESELI